MSDWDRTMQRRNYAASCPNCGGYAVVEQVAECSRCEANLGPACPNCRQVIDIGKTLAAGMCAMCGELVDHFELVRLNTTTHA